MPVATQHKDTNSNNDDQESDSDNASDDDTPIHGNILQHFCMLMLPCLSSFFYASTLLFRFKNSQCSIYLK